MALWLVRAGKHGEPEKKFLDENRVYLTWGGLNSDLTKIETKAQLREILEETFPDASKGRITNNTGQVWAFSKGIKASDWIILPSKLKPAIHIAEAKGTYQFDPNGVEPFFHYIDVKWVAEDIPRSNFDQDILYSLGAFMTVCQIKRNDAEKRVRGMQKVGWKTTPSVPALPGKGSGDDEDEVDGEGLEDLEQAAKDQIAKRIIAFYKGHGLARLVDAVLRAQGYTTYLSPEGPDKGSTSWLPPAPWDLVNPRSVSK